MDDDGARHLVVQCLSLAVAGDHQAGHAQEEVSQAQQGVREAEHRAAQGALSLAERGAGGADHPQPGHYLAGGAPSRGEEEPVVQERGQSPAEEEQETERGVEGIRGLLQAGVGQEDEEQDSEPEQEHEHAQEEVVDDPRPQAASEPGEGHPRGDVDASVRGMRDCGIAPAPPGGIGMRNPVRLSRRVVPGRNSHPNIIASCRDMWGSWLSPPFPG